MLIFALSGLELPIGERADCGLSDRLLQRGLLQNLRLQQVTTSLQTTNNSQPLQIMSIAYKEKQNKGHLQPTLSQ